MTVSSPSYQNPPSDCIYVRVLVLTDYQDLFSYGHAKNRGMNCIVVDAIRAKDEAVLALVVSQYILNGEHKNIGCWSNSYVAALKD